MVPILDVMKESSTMPAELVDEWKDSWKNSQLSKVMGMSSFWFFPHSLFFSDSVQGGDEVHPGKGEEQAKDEGGSQSFGTMEA